MAQTPPVQARNFIVDMVTTELRGRPMENERGSGSPWVFLGIGIAAVLVAHTLQGRDLVRATATSPKSHLMAVIGDTHRTSEASPFLSADMTAIAGDCTLDLSRATIPAGEEATIEVFALMGSISVRVPDGWTVDTRTMPVLGGISDLRIPSTSTGLTALETGQAPRLVLRGFVMMGSLFIRS